MISPGDQRGGNFYVTVALGDDGWTKFSSFNMTAQADMFSLVRADVLHSPRPVCCCWAYFVKHLVL